MTCPRCGGGNHRSAVCPEVREEYHGVPRDHFDEDDESNSVSLRDEESRDDNVHARRNAAQPAIAEDETEDNNE